MRNSRLFGPANLLALAVYVVGVLGFANVPVLNSLARAAGGVELPPCGCTDPDCQCGAPCCSPEAKALRQALAQGDEDQVRALREALARRTEACCSSDGAEACHCDLADNEIVLTTACLCGRTRTLATITFGDSHLVALSPEPRHAPIPGPCLQAPAAILPWLPGDSPDKVPIGA